jgi:N-methylhydantoinase A/oxoprolinase/acetone carboxylase beta subunit
VVVAGGGVVEALVVGRDSLRQGEVLTGPVIVTQQDATTWVAPGWRATVGQWGDLHLNPALD